MPAMAVIAAVTAVEMVTTTTTAVVGAVAIRGTLRKVRLSVEN